MNIIGVGNVFKHKKVKQITIFIGTFLVIYFILCTTMMTKKYDLSEGDIAKENIKAPREVKDDISTEARIEDELKSVQPEYTKSDVKYTVLDQVKTLFSKINQVEESPMENKDKIIKLKNESSAISIPLAEEDITAILKLSKDELSELQNDVTRVISDLYENNSIVDSSEGIKKAQDYVFLIVNKLQISKTMKDLTTHIVYSNIKPNYAYDKDKTEDKKLAAIKKVAPVMIKKDQIIIKEGEPVSKYQIELLKNLGLLNTNKKLQWTLYVSLAVIVIFILAFQWFYIKSYHAEIYNDCSKLLLLSLLNSIALVLARTVSMISPFLIPLSFVPMILTILIEHRVSLTVSAMNCVFISILVGFNIEVTLIALINAILGAVIIKRMQQRNDILYSSIYISIINLFITFFICLLLSNNTFVVFKNSIYVFAASLIGGILTIGFLPFFENTFDIVTTIKLLEISNPNHPLLKKLLIEAPGTYHHSILVANLAEVAAEEVGANPVLARVASYYHDIGKIKRPYFFKENQLGTENPHDKITPNLSSLIITSHVKDGLELAREYKIPKTIQEIIEQHHGNSLVKYFYITMKNSSENPDEIKEEEFKYPGPIPSSKEAGIIMLADSVEAAVRSINMPTNEKIEEMVSGIIKSRVNENQLDNCDLTLKDLSKINVAFVKVLISIYHKRIEYPTDKWQTSIQK